MIKRTYFDKNTFDWTLSADGEDKSLEDSLVMTCLILGEAPTRTLKLSASTRKPLIIASDAQASSNAVSAAFLVVDVEDGRRWGYFWRFNKGDLAALGYPGFPEPEEKRNPIAAAEAAAVSTAFKVLVDWHSDRMAHRDIVHWIDNTVALHSFVKGGSKSPPVDRACSIAFSLAYKNDFRVWFEFVPSEANWSDGASRELANDKFSFSNGFALSECQFPKELWLCDLHVLWQSLCASS